MRKLSTHFLLEDRLFYIGNNVNFSRHAPRISTWGSLFNEFSTRWIVPGAQRIFTWGSFFKDELFQAHHIISLRRSFFLHDELFQARHIFRLGIAFMIISERCFRRAEIFSLEDRLSKMICSRHTTYFHLRIVFFHESSMSLGRRTTYFHMGIVFQRIFCAMNCSRRKTYFRLRIVFLTKLGVYAMSCSRQSTNIPLEDRFSKTNCSRRATYNIIPLENRFYQKRCYRRAKIFPLEDRLSKMNCFRHNTYFHLHLRIVFLHESSMSFAGTPRISKWGSLFKEFSTR